MYQLVLIRHGESVWNLENRFTGWVDVALTETGIEQAKQAGALLKQHGFAFDVAYTSVLDRAIATLWHGLVAMDSTWIPVHKHWRLNERHYGGLQGLNKADMARQFGDEQVLKWRRSYDTPPPVASEQEHNAQCQDPRYRGLAPNQLPHCESLKDTVKRVLPLWDCVIAPSILSDKRVLISAHGNSIRALVKYLDQVDDKDITDLNIPNGKPLVYTLDQNLNPIKHHYLEAL